MRCSYDELRTLYLGQLAFLWMEDSTTEATRVSVDQKIDSFAEGDLEHATEIILALLDITTKDGDIKSPAGTPPNLIVRSSWFCPLSGVILKCFPNVSSVALGPLNI